MERHRGRGLRALSVDTDWCGTEPDRGLSKDWCGSDTEGGDARARTRGDWCGTDRQSPGPDDISLLLGHLSSRLRRS